MIPRRPYNQCDPDQLKKWRFSSKTFLSYFVTRVIVVHRKVQIITTITASEHVEVSITSQIRGKLKPLERVLMDQIKIEIATVLGALRDPVNDTDAKGLALKERAVQRLCSCARHPNPVRFFFFSLIDACEVGS